MTLKVRIFVALEVTGPGSASDHWVTVSDLADAKLSPGDLAEIVAHAIEARARDARADKRLEVWPPQQSANMPIK